MIFEVKLGLFSSFFLLIAPFIEAFILKFANPLVNYIIISSELSILSKNKKKYQIIYSYQVGENEYKAIKTFPIYKSNMKIEKITESLKISYIPFLPSISVLQSPYKLETQKRISVLYGVTVFIVTILIYWMSLNLPQ